VSDERWDAEQRRLALIGIERAGLFGGSCPHCYLPFMNDWDKEPHCRCEDRPKNAREFGEEAMIALFGWIDPKVKGAHGGQVV
jgi:hypothetical protein